MSLERFRRWRATRHPDLASGKPEFAATEVLRVRFNLMQSHQLWDRLSADLFARQDVPPEALPLRMLASHAYTLAAVLKRAEELAGPEMACQLAVLTEELLDDGDFEDINADLPATDPESGPQ